jgi:hypothetical protein
MIRHYFRISVYFFCLSYNKGTDRTRGLIDITNVITPWSQCSKLSPPICRQIKDLRFPRYREEELSRCNASEKASGESH